jgi:hypothetical protein
MTMPRLSMYIPIYRKPSPKSRRAELLTTSTLPILIGNSKPTPRIAPVNITIRADNTAGTIFETSLIGYTKPVSLPLIDMGGTGVDTRFQFTSSTDALVNNNKVGGVIGHIPVQIKLVLYLHRTALHP